MREWSRDEAYTPTRFGLVLADAGYGCSATFRAGLSARGLAWAVGAPSNVKVYPADVKWLQAEPKPGRPSEFLLPDKASEAADAVLERAKWHSVTWLSGSIVLDGATTDGNIFFRLCPGPLLVLLVVLSILATIIASQSIITGAFSMPHQAIRLGWMPRLAVRQTSAASYGQIYIGAVNWLLMLVMLGLTLGFRKSDSLASAYRIAVSLTMLMTTVLLYIAMREVWRWSMAVAGVVAGFFLIVDAAFSSNLVKVLDGGYVPLLLAALVYGAMWTWHHGTEAAAASLVENAVEVGDFTAQAVAHKTPRVPGTAVFLTRTDMDVPPSLVWHLAHNKALHEHLVALTVETARVPAVAEAEHLDICEIAPNFWRARAKYGFMERPDVPALLRGAAEQEYDLGLDDATYYAGTPPSCPATTDLACRGSWKPSTPPWSGTRATWPTCSACPPRPPWN